MEKYFKPKMSSFFRMLVCVSFLIWPNGTQSDIDMEVYVNRFNPTFTINISFTLEMFTRLQACFCDPNMIQCRAKYSIADDTMVQDIAVVQGSIDSSLLTCENRLESSSLLCAKVNDSIDPCNYPVASDFFMMPSSIDCPKTCFGFFWNNSKERFVSSNAAVESCDRCGDRKITTSRITTTISTTTNSPTTTSMTTTTTPTTSTSTATIEIMPSSTAPTTTKISPTTSTKVSSVSSSMITITPTPTPSPITPLDTTLTNVSSSPSSNTGDSDSNSNDDNETLIIGLVVGLSVLAIVIVILAVIVWRQRRQSLATKSLQTHKSSAYALPAPTELVTGTAENNRSRLTGINYYSSPRTSSDVVNDSRYDYVDLYDLPEDDNGETVPEENETVPEYSEAVPEYSETVQEYIVAEPGEPVPEDNQTVPEGRGPPSVCQSGTYITPTADPVDGGTFQMYEEESIIPHW